MAKDPHVGPGGGIFGETLTPAAFEKSALPKDIVESPTLARTWPRAPRPYPAKVVFRRQTDLLTMRTTPSTICRLQRHPNAVADAEKEPKTSAAAKVYDLAGFFDENVDIPNLSTKVVCPRQSPPIDRPKSMTTVVKQDAHSLSNQPNQIGGGRPIQKYLAKLRTKGKTKAPSGQIENSHPRLGVTATVTLASHCISTRNCSARRLPFLHDRSSPALTRVDSVATGHFPLPDVSDTPGRSEELTEELARDSGIKHNRRIDPWPKIITEEIRRRVKKVPSETLSMTRRAVHIPTAELGKR